MSARPIPEPPFVCVGCGHSVMHAGAALERLPIMCAVCTYYSLEATMQIADSGEDATGCWFCARGDRTHDGSHVMPDGWKMRCANQGADA